VPLPPPRTIIITGASSGLGASLAQTYAEPGRVLGLVGRDSVRLSAIAAACRQAGADVREAVLDVADAEPLGRWIEEFDDATPIDLVIANAGVSAGVPPSGAPEGLYTASAQVKINLLGTMNTIEPLLPRMIARGAGHIVVLSSVAGYRGLPYSPGYSASKAGVRMYGDALRSLLRPKGIRVSVVCPGFFASPMTDRFIGGHPMKLTLDQATRIVRRGIDRAKRRIVFPRLLAFELILADIAPAFITDWIMRRIHFHILPARGTEP